VRSSLVDLQISADHDRRQAGVSPLIPRSTLKGGSAMKRFLGILFATAIIAPTAQAHDESIQWICTKPDGDHVFLTANHAAGPGLETANAATADVNLRLANAVCRIQ
jgi:hypothetical protein